VARFAVTGANVGVYVYRDGTLVDSATGTTTGETPAEVTLTKPAAGDYTIYVNAQPGTPTPDGTTPPDAAPPTVGQLSTWVVPAEGGSQVDLSTDAVGFAPGKKFSYSASWDKLDPSKKYLGVVSYGDSDHQTLVEVN
jgi:hypothetical protein